MCFYMKWNTAINQLPMFACHTLLALAPPIQNHPILCGTTNAHPFWIQRSKYHLHQVFPTTSTYSGSTLTSLSHTKCDWSDQSIFNPFFFLFSLHPQFKRGFLVGKFKLRQYSTEFCREDKTWSSFYQKYWNSLCTFRMVKPSHRCLRSA